MKNSVNSINSILDTVFKNEGTKIAFSSSIEVHNAALGEHPLSGSNSLNVNLKFTEDEKCEVIADLICTDPEAAYHDIVKLTVKKSFIEALTTILLGANDSVKIEKIL